MIQVKRIINNFFSNAEHKQVVSNILSLSILQGLNFLLPLITFPYQVRVIGAEKFGLLAFASSMIAYFNVVVDFGFYLTAPREIALHRDNNEKLSEIVSSVLQIKLLLLIFSTVILIILVLSVERFRRDSLIYFITFGTVLGQMLFPVWFFQGIERMKYITLFNVLARSVFTILIFVVVRKASDFYYIPLLTTIGSVLAAIGSFYIIIVTYKIKIKWQKINVLKSYFVESFPLFISRFAISIYTSSTVFILGFFTNYTIVGYFVIADKVIQICKQGLAPITQSLFPFITKRIYSDKETGLAIIRTVLKYIGFVTFCISIFTFVCAPQIISVISGVSFQKSVLLLRIMSFIPLFTAFSNVLGTLTMISLKMNKEYSKVLILGSSLNVLLSLVLVPLLNDIGSAITVTLVEFFITILMFSYLSRGGIKLVGKK